MNVISSASFAYFLAFCTITWLSRKPLRQPGSHGFYRFFAWQGILALFAFHHPSWAENSLSSQPLVSAVLMASSIALVISGWLELKRQGRATIDRRDETLFDFEKTTVLVSSGIFRFIRHPMYASLLFLAWGAFWQRPTTPGILVLVFTTISLLLTAHADERECLAYFGDAYTAYRQRTWAFVPWMY